jgi:PAS domain-containing protein
MSSILLRPNCPAEDDPEIRRLLELIATSSSASYVELELEPPSGEAHRYRLGRPTAEASSQPLELRHHRATLRLGGIGRIPDRLPDLVAYCLDRILLCLRFSAQVSILRAALDTTTSAVLLFDHDGDIVYANPPADALLSQQTEVDIEAESPSERLQPLFTRVRSMVEKVLDGEGLGEVGARGLARPGPVVQVDAPGRYGRHIARLGRDVGAVLAKGEIRGGHR